MGDDERDVHEREDDARRARAEAEADRAAAERERETGRDESVLPPEAEERQAVMPPGDDRDS